MNNIYINLNEFQQIILDFIKTNEYKKFVESTQDNPDSYFVNGLITASILTSAKCTHYTSNCQDE